MAISPASKTYPPSGTSPRLKLRRQDPRSGLQLIHRKMSCLKRAEVVRGNGYDRRLIMWDVVMLALGLGFFAAGIGYAYACERL
jgi:hypothetical protein